MTPSTWHGTGGVAHLGFELADHERGHRPHSRCRTPSARWRCLICALSPSSSSGRRLSKRETSPSTSSGHISAGRPSTR
jgi:hypothetical protein